jgi:hypothetical protein
MSDPHDIAADLRGAAALCEGAAISVTDEGWIGRGARLEALADSFDQPGPLAYSETEGRMVRLERVRHFTLERTEWLWRFPSRVTTEGADRG